MEEIKNNASQDSEETNVMDGAVDVLGKQTGLLDNTLKLMDGKFGGGFYVRYIYDIGRGCGWLQLLIEYPTGTVQTQLLCKNVCKATSYEEDGLGEVEGISYDRLCSGEKTIFKPHLADSLRNGLYDIVRVYERPDMPIPMKAIWQRIVENNADIPVMELSVKCSLQDVYDALIERAETLIERDISRIGKGCVLLTKKEVEDTVSELGYSLQEIRTEFAVRGLWVTDKNSGSYQKTKKLNGATKRFYALKTELTAPKVAGGKVVENVDYTEKIPPTKESAEIYQLQQELASMKKQRDDMIQIVCERVPDLTQQEIMDTLL